MLFKYQLCDFIKQLIQLFEAIFPLTETMKYLIWTKNQFQYCYKKVKISDEAVSSSNIDTFAAAISLIRMVYRYLSKFLAKFYGVSYYFSKILTEVALEEKICKCSYRNLRKKCWKISVVVTSLSNNERACNPTLLKTVYTIDILIGQVHKFQNSYFKEQPWKAATVLQKAYCLRRVV